MRYEIHVEGMLDDCWSAWFDGMQITSHTDGVTAIVGAVTDQAALHGLLAKVRDLGLPLISGAVPGGGPTLRVTPRLVAAQ